MNQIDIENTNLAHNNTNLAHNNNLLVDQNNNDKCSKINYEKIFRFVSVVLVLGVFSWIFYVSFKYEYQIFEGTVINSQIYNSSTELYNLNLYASNNKKINNNYCVYDDYYSGSYDDVIEVSQNMTSQHVKWIIHNYNVCEKYNEEKLYEMNSDLILTVLGFVLVIVSDLMLVCHIDLKFLNILICFHTGLIWFFRQYIIESSENK